MISSSRPHFVSVSVAVMDTSALTEVDFDGITAYQRYKLMASLIVPRPIALVTTVGPTGVVNAAPFSTWSAKTRRS